MKDFSLIVPTIAETQCTGFRIAAEKTIRRVEWRVEYWAMSPYPKVFRNGAKIELAAIPKHVVPLVMAAKAFLR